MRSTRVIRRVNTIYPAYVAPKNAKLSERSLEILPDLISEREENLLIESFAPLLNFRYQGTHWDDVIVKYREVELDVHQNPLWLEVTGRIHEAVKRQQGRPNLAFLPPHVVDLAADGHIGPHVDSVKFSGDIVAGVSLLSCRVMRLDRDVEAHAALAPDHPAIIADAPDINAVEFFLPRRSLYIMAGPLRYFFSHQVLGQGSPSGLPALLPPACSDKPVCDPQTHEHPHSAFQRRISIITRDVFV